jgi:dihydropteroate synthase
MAVERGAHVVRTHDVKETRDAALVGKTFTRNRVRTDTVEELDVTAVREARRQFAGGHPDVAVEGDPEATVARLFALDIPAAATKTLREAAADTDTVVASTGKRTLLGGQVSALRSLAATVSDPPALVDALSRVREGCR